MKPKNEIWKPIKGYNGNYEISNIGRVKSFMGKAPKILKIYIDRYGYEYVALSKNRAMKKHKVHRLVAKHFIGEPKSNKQINHKNGIKTDNYPENLEWCTASENINHAIETGLRDSIGEANASAKLNTTKVLDIRNTYRIGCFTQQEIADAHEVSRQIVGAIIRREVWNHV